MRIESMDASSTGFAISQSPRANTNTNTNTKDNNDSSDITIPAKDNKNISQMTEWEKKELPVSEKVLIDAIEKANKAISGANTKFEFSIHQKTKEIMVKVIDSDTNKVIREIPPEKILDMVAKMWEMAGIIVDERR